MRLQATENLGRYQQETRKWRDKNISEKNFVLGDLVLRRFGNASSMGKIQSKWDGPFLVKRSLRPSSYHLANMEGDELPHTWNVDNLCKFYA